jgi:hypothetical protein
MKKNLLYFTLVIIFLFPTMTFAWGKEGHALVAKVAFNYLSEKTKARVLAQLNGLTIEEAANWMDDIKKDKSLDYMKPWHYVNFDKNEPVTNENSDNVIFELTKSIQNLSNNKLTDFQKNQNLLILFHLIGDIHQPLHVGYGEDKGGNDVQIFFNGKGTNLHRLFDYGIIEYKKITLSDVLLSEKLSKSKIKNISKLNVIGWAKESRSNLDAIYNFSGHKIDEDYVTENEKIIKKQILYAGIRLASILEQTFGK